MSEQVVYEDTPFADYLQSIESLENFVQQFDPQDPPSTKPPKLLGMSILQEKALNLFKSYTSTSLPPQEEAAFEEGFKYIIATSSLLNDTLSIQRNSFNAHNQSHKATAATTPAPSFFADPSAIFFSFSIGISGFAMATLVRRSSFSPSRRWGFFLSAILTASSLTALSIFFLYRHLRVAYLRALRETTLTSMRSLIASSYTLDSRIQKTLHLVQEVELVSRGYRLSMPLAPITRIDQANKHRRCVRTRLALVETLTNAFESYQQVVLALEPFLNRDNLAAFYDMYGVVPVISLDTTAPESDPTSLDTLKKTFLLVHFKRRECLLAFLALDVLSHEVREKRRSPRGKGVWSVVGRSLGDLGSIIDELVGKMENVLEGELYNPPQPLAALPTSLPTTPQPIQPFLHHLASIEHQLRAVHAKLYLCSDDARNSPDPEQTIKPHYDSLRADLEALFADYEAGRSTLAQLSYPKSLAPDEPQSLPDPVEIDEGYPSPPLSPPLGSVDEETLESEAGVWEGVAGGAKLERRVSRRERIEEMKRKREKEVEEKVQKVETEKLVNELKDVLGRRAGEGMIGSERQGPTREHSEDLRS